MWMQFLVAHKYFWRKVEPDLGTETKNRDKKFVICISIVWQIPSDDCIIFDIFGDHAPGTYHRSVLFLRRH